MSERRERPILFSGPMVRAILEGRKTQTRRVVKPQPNEYSAHCGWVGGPSLPEGEGACKCKPIRYPYGVPGDRLWVKEAIALDFKDGEYAQSSYVADGDLTKADAWPWKLKTLPAMFCPRGLSRLTLEVKAVRVERLQEISQADAQEEGMRGPLIDIELDRIVNQVGVSPREAYGRLWDSINAKRGHGRETNPWVWVVEFVRVNP